MQQLLANFANRIKLWNQIKVKKVKECASYLWKSISELRSVTCRMGSHSVIYDSTQVNTPRLYPSQTGWYSIYRPFKDGGLSKPRPRVQRATVPRLLRDSPGQRDPNTRTNTVKIQFAHQTVVRLAPVQCVAPLAANNLQSGLSSASSVASSTLKLWYDRSFFTVAIQEVWGRPASLFQSLQAARILLAHQRPGKYE